MKGFGIVINCKGLAFTCSKMEMYIKVNLKMVRGMGKEVSNLKTGGFTKELLRTINNMVLEFTPIKMGLKTFQSLREGSI
jgi:hypothetical protein